MTSTSTSVTAGRALAGGEHSTTFVGRTWVFERIDAWLAAKSARYFHLVGEPGSGKSALARQLARFSAGSVPPPASMATLGPDFIDALHFCTARDRRMVNPLMFAESVAMQLSQRHPEVTEAILEASGAPKITVEQHVGEAQAAVTGVVIQQLNARGASPEDAFDRLVREPLEVLFRSSPERRVVILVDALDESLVYGGEVGIVPLLAQAATLPDGVRFLLTSRPEPEIERRLGLGNAVERLHLSATSWDAQNHGDIAAYVASRFADDPVIAPQVTALGTAAASRAADAITERSGGNFLYAQFLLDAVAAERGTLAELADRAATAGARGSTGMDALYLLYVESLQRVIDIGKQEWVTQYAPIMETLSAAQETLPREKLRTFAGQADAAFRRNLDDLGQFIEPAAATNGEMGYRLYHQSFVDFLRTPTVRQGGSEIENPYTLTAAASHARMADRLEKAHGDAWDACDDRYALRYAALHQAEAARVDEQPERHDRTRALVELVTSDAFQRAHEHLLADPTALRNDLERTLVTAVADDHVAAPPLVVRAALALDALRRRDGRPGVIFDLARAGDVAGAERRLGILRADAGWRQAVSLTIAWLAAASNAADALALRNRVVQEGVEPMLAPLLTRLDVDLLHNVPPSVPPPPLPGAADEQHIVQILERLGGNPVTGIEPLDLERVNAEGIVSGDAAPSYLAEVDGPALVAFAIREGERGTTYLERYIAMQASNGYEFYRNRSLWALIAPVLTHPDAAWVRDRLVRLGTGALAVSPVQFREALPLTVLALRARGGDAAAAAELDAQRARAIAEADQVRAMRAGDPWGHHLRRLIALAEIASCVLEHPTVAADLRGVAASLPYGFAGFNASARLTLAELVRLTAPADTGAIAAAFDSALGSAHNVQDAVFCARATSRVTAMRWWWNELETAALPPLVAALGAEPGAPRFGARHTVGEQYAMRGDTGQRLPIPAPVRQADTLEALARTYLRPIADFVRFAAAHGWSAGDHLALGTVVSVPDPDFPPLLAARLATEVLVAPGFAASRRARMVQTLVPVAARDATSLDVVLSRLLLAALPTDTAAMTHLAESVARFVPEEVLKSVPSPDPRLPA